MKTRYCSVLKYADIHNLYLMQDWKVVYCNQLSFHHRYLFNYNKIRNFNEFVCGRWHQKWMVTPYTKFEFDSLNHEVFLSHLFFYPLYAKKSTRTSVEQMRKYSCSLWKRTFPHTMHGVLYSISMRERVPFAGIWGETWMLMTCFFKTPNGKWVRLRHSKCGVWTRFRTRLLKRKHITKSEYSRWPSHIFVDD